MWRKWTVRPLRTAAVPADKVHLNVMMLEKHSVERIDGLVDRLLDRE